MVDFLLEGGLSILCPYDVRVTNKLCFRWTIMPDVTTYHQWQPSAWCTTSQKLRWNILYVWHGIANIYTAFCSSLDFGSKYAAQIHTNKWDVFKFLWKIKWRSKNCTPSWTNELGSNTELKMLRCSNIMNASIRHLFLSLFFPLMHSLTGSEGIMERNGQHFCGTGSHPWNWGNYQWMHFIAKV